MPPLSGKYCHWVGCCRRRPQTSLPFSPPSSLSRGHASSLPCRARPSVECCVLLPALKLRRCCAPPLASPRFFRLLHFVLGLPFSTLFKRSPSCCLGVGKEVSKILPLAIHQQIREPLFFCQPPYFFVQHFLKMVLNKK